MTIRDFCAGGLFLQYPARGGGPRDDADTPTRVEVTFVDPSGDSDCVCQADVVRDTGAGLAVAFREPRLDVVTILTAVADGQADGGARAVAPGGSDELTREVLGVCERHAVAFAERVLPDFAAHAVDELFEQSRAATSNTEQSAFFAGFRRLRGLREDLPERFMEGLRERLWTLASADAGTPSSSPSATAAGDTAELELVDEAQFEDWLNRSEIVNRAETRDAVVLEALTRRLSHVVGRHLDERSNPLAPAALSEVLALSLPLDEFEAVVSRTLYRLFGRIVFQPLGELYEALNRELRQRRILPGIEDEPPEIRMLGGDAQRRREQSAGPDDPSPQAEAPEAPEAPVSAGAGALAPAPADAPPQPLADPRTAPPGASRQGAPAEALARFRQLREARASSRAETAAPSAAAPAPSVSQADLMAAIDALEPEASEPGRGLVDEVLAGVGAGDLSALPAGTRDTVEVMDEWFGDVGRNALNTDLLRDWSGRLAVFALRLQLQSGDFLDASPKPIHALLDELDRVGVALATLHPDQRAPLRERVEDILRRVLREQSERPECVSEGAREMAGLIDRPMRARAANMQKVLQQCEGSHKLERARREVNRELDQRLSGREVPKPLIDFIEEAWRHLLVLLRLRTNGEGDQWRRALAVIDRLMAVLGTGSRRARPIPEHDKVFAFIQKQLETFSRVTPPAERLLTQMRCYADEVCAQGRASRPLPMVRAPAMALDEEAGSDVDPHWLGQAKLLEVGDWVFFAGDDGEPEPQRLQWVSTDRDRFVFVNRSGYRAREASLVELAELMQASAAGVADDLDAPLTERQWQRKLQAMHEEMIHFATHDTVTGLLNRKAMTRQLERIAESERAASRPHALLYFAVDRFKVVNTTLGYETGDYLLGQVARQLREATGREDRVGRVGADEFAVFLCNTSAARAEVFAEEQRKRILELRVGDGDNSFSVSASCGLVAFQFNGRSPASVLQDADDACTTAKQAGGGQMHRTTADDRELAELRGSMVRAAQVDAALESGGLRLRAQRIEPVGEPAPGFKPFYEILIAIGTDSGGYETVLSPAEFMPAAERFGRMATVDRAVITGVLEWCRDHPAALEGLGGFAINIAGPSLNDPRFAAFLSETFQRTGVAPGLICFEVTETMAVQNLARAADLMREVRALGCRFALDDFGTGHASYTYLKNLPIDYLKIDGEFIRHMDENDADFAMVRSINELAHYLGKRTIAEYVENERILGQVREVAVDYAQGYAVGRPMPLDEVFAS